MRNIKEIEILRAVLHVLDRSMNEPIMSQYELELNEETYEFVAKHIIKISADEEAKCGVFDCDNNDVKNLSLKIMSDENEFLNASSVIADKLFSIVKNNGEIPSGDLLICLFNCEYGKMLGILKLDYNKTYIHGIEYQEKGLDIRVIPQMIGLPSPSQRLQKAALVTFDNEKFEILLIDKNKKKDIDSGLGEYFSKDFIGYSYIKDKREVTKDILNASEEWIRKKFKEDADKAEKARSIITRSLKQDDVINVETIAEVAFDKSEEHKNDYINALRESGIEDREVPVDREWLEKKLKRKKLKIDKDIDIYIDHNAYEDNDRFEIKRNGDGSINIVIKHVRNYIEKQ